MPGCASGREPYGSYTARALFVPAQWTDDAEEADDIAFVAVNTLYSADLGSVAQALYNQAAHA